MLRKVLCGLAVQKGYSGQYEIVIVDNGSEEDILRNISNLVGTLPIRYFKRRLAKNHFRPGSARNIGVQHARYNMLVFLDSDCVPSEYFINTHFKAISFSQGIITIGHRVFVDGSIVTESLILRADGSLSRLNSVKSDSNYYQAIDRRIPELRVLSRHPAPYNCLHGCNVGLRKHDFCDAGKFDVAFDGHWGYEDIELGYRLFQVGIRYRYLPTAPVYHLEGDGLSLSERLEGRRRNFVLACKKIPNYDSFRRTLGR